ncbi:MAG TPA: hypothetical protein PKJ99_01415 [Thermoanaerobaculales bacterium]|nr:hypothetical protein [Thermoanaerobaculales bacterium]HPA79668.1 hypothetical protein [Thermoanaerobaculales bacterium]
MTAATRLIAAGLAALGAVVLAAPGAPAGETAAPAPVVERILTIRDREIRTSLFSNAVVVVSGRRGGERGLFRQVTLPADQYAGYLAAIQRDAAELAEADELPSASGSGGRGVVTVHVAPGGPIRFTYSSMTVYSLAATRLIATLDDLEQQALVGVSAGPGVDRWQPRVGDVVRLRGGAVAELIEVRDDGALVLEHRGSYINELVPAGEIRTLVVEVIEHAP